MTACEAPLDHRSPGTGRTVLLSTVSSDAHTWNLLFLQLLLEEAGCTVVNLGPCVPPEETVASAERLAPDAIVISTVNGHGHRDGVLLGRRLRANPATVAIPVVIGGKIGVDGDSSGFADELLDAGFNAVFTDDTDPAELIARLGIAELGVKP